MDIEHVTYEDNAALYESDARLMLRSPWPARVNDALFERAAMTLFAICAFLPYFAINWITRDWPARDLTSPVDQLIPFSPVWELIYVSIYFYVFVLVAYIRDAQLFRRVVISFVAIQFTCFVAYLVMPVGIQRPTALDLHGSFLEWGIALNYTLDHPRNLFPSLHLANAFMVSLLLLRVQRGAGIAALIWAALIGYSTMAAKHHFFADVVSGIVVAALADRMIVAPAVNDIPPRLRAQRLLNPPAYAVGVIALYPLTVLALFLAWKGGWQPFVWLH